MWIKKIIKRYRASADATKKYLSDTNESLKSGIKKELKDIDETESIDQEKADKQKELLNQAVKILTVVVMVGLAFQFVGFAQVSGSSMENTYHDRDFVIIVKKAHIKTGDIVLCKMPDQNMVIIKRVIATAGDTVSVQEGYVYVNEEKIAEPYVKKSGCSGEMDSYTVPKDSVFLMGDNRSDSYDSRAVGAIKEDHILGKVILK